MIVEDPDNKGKETTNEFVRTGKTVDIVGRTLSEGDSFMGVASIMDARYVMRNRYKPSLSNVYIESSDVVIYPQKLHGISKDYYYVILTTKNDGEITENGKKALEYVKPGTLPDFSKMDVEDDVKKSASFIEYYTPLVNSDDLANNRGAIVTNLEELTQGDNVFRIGKDETSKLCNVLTRHPDVVPDYLARDPQFFQDYKELIGQSELKVEMGSGIKDEDTLKLITVGTKASLYDIGGKEYLNNFGAHILLYARSDS